MISLPQKQTFLLWIITNSGGDSAVVSGGIRKQTSAKRSSNPVPFDRMSKSGDGEGSRM